MVTTVQNLPDAGAETCDLRACEPDALADEAGSRRRGDESTDRPQLGEDFQDDPGALETVR